MFKFQTGSNPVQVTVTDSGELRVSIHQVMFEYCYNYTPLQYTFIRTPITDSFMYSAVHALSKKLGSNPFGPTGTGKTESVKALGKLLGRQVVVFCCDDSFDCDAFARIFAGMRLSGAWGCFDEFNRLSESVLSSVSKQVYDLMYDPSSQSGTLSQSVFLGVFITMNPGYRGRNELPDNLGHLFCPFALSLPDASYILECSLFAIGYPDHSLIARRTALLLSVCSQIFSGSDYDLV